MCSARKRPNAAFAAIASRRSGKTSTRQKNRARRLKCLSPRRRVFRRLIARLAVAKSGWRIARRALTFRLLRNSTTRTQRKRRAKRNEERKARLKHGTLCGWAMCVCVQDPICPVQALRRAKPGVPVLQAHGAARQRGHFRRPEGKTNRAAI